MLITLVTLMGKGLTLTLKIIFKKLNLIKNYIGFCSLNYSIKHGKDGGPHCNKMRENIFKRNETISINSTRKKNKVNLK